MVYRQFWTKNYEHEYLFSFKDKKYFVYSIVELTEDGRRYLESRKKQVILTEHFIRTDGKHWWTYEIGYAHNAQRPLRVSTDRDPNEIIEKVILPASADYTERELFGVNASSYTNGIKHTEKDWNIPEVRKAWISYILIFIGAAFFKDWYIKLIIRAVAGLYFLVYRQAYVDACTTYTHEEDKEILKKKYEILYGVKFDKENSNE